MDKRDDRIETEGEERAIKDRLRGFGGDPLGASSGAAGANRFDCSRFPPRG
jgi:hypothetical protein